MFRSPQAILARVWALAIIGVGLSTGLSSAYNTCGAAAPIVPTETVTTETATTETATSDDPSGLSGRLTWVWALVLVLALN